MADHAMDWKDSIDFGGGFAGSSKTSWSAFSAVEGSTVTNSTSASPVITGPAVMFCTNPETRPRRDQAAGSSLKQVAFAFPRFAPSRTLTRGAYSEKNPRLG